MVISGDNSLSYNKEKGDTQRISVFLVAERTGTRKWELTKTEFSNHYMDYHLINYLDFDGDGTDELIYYHKVGLNGLPYGYTVIERHKDGWVDRYSTTGERFTC